uniref:Uncharacterized protein n=1 Tax=Siphoviridae sp. ctuyW65 TaxID=2826508 RepID=A0A8S5QVI5_9CAUD|nr:MAG TPA: hypothetical protein [Siphoviridae sp. ctuyW65]
MLLNEMLNEVLRENFLKRLNTDTDQGEIIQNARKFWFPA